MNWEIFWTTLIFVIGLAYLYSGFSNAKAGNDRGNFQILLGAIMVAVAVGLAV